MKKNRFNSICLAVLALILVSLACGSFQTPPLSTPTAASTSTSTSTSVPTATARPTNTLWPTQTPDLAATQQTLDLQSRIQRYVQNGYLASDKGNYFKLHDDTYQLAKMNFWTLKVRDTTTR